MLNFLKKIYYYTLFRLFKSKFIVQNNYSGFNLNVQIVDPISYEWYNKNWDILPEIDFIQKNVKGVQLIFDLGAHHGVIAMILSKSFPDSKVVSVEAIPNNHYQCIFNYKLNNLDCIVPLNNAISNTNTIISFENTSNGITKRMKSKNLVNIKSLQIDDLIHTYGVPDILFIDIEGFEQKALEGIINKKMILNSVFFIEVHINCGLEENGGDLCKIIHFFESSFSHDLFYLKEGDSKVCKGDAENLLKIDDRFYLIAIPSITTNC